MPSEIPLAVPPVWYAIPSARPDGGTLKLWKERGYRVAVQRDPVSGAGEGSVGRVVEGQGIEFYREYNGYADAVNFLCKEILLDSPETKIIVTGGDDIEPPAPAPLLIQETFVGHFGPDLYGVMQPTGDRWMVDEAGRSCSERVAYSPWMGRGWCQRANLGTGPLWHEYTHFYVDEELQEVALRQDAFWQRPDLSQYHHHWIREGEPNQGKRPPHLVGKDSQEKWRKAKALFTTRKAAGYPGSERLVG